LLVDAKWQEADVHFRRNLAYSTTTYATNGAVLVGDAAAFIDPFYSPGMDWISFSTSAAAALILDSFRGKPIAPRVAMHNARFLQSYDRWFRALYLDKYYYMGDYDLMTLAFPILAMRWRTGHRNSLFTIDISSLGSRKKTGKTYMECLTFLARRESRASNS